VGTAPCDDVLTLPITVGITADATWAAPANVCDSDPPIDLNTLVTGTVGGAWSGTGVTGNNFDPSVGTQTITYNVGTAPCDDVLALAITVSPTADATWNLPPATCSNAPDIDLDALVTGTAGGVWSGTGVTGNLFDPSSGTQNVTYTVGTAPCDDVVTQSIVITPSLDPTWVSPGTICETAGTVDLAALLTGDTGGTWSGTGVTGSTFDPAGLSGNISITYTIGVAPCVGTDTQDIIVNPDVDPTWTAPVSLCQTSAPVDLATMITGTAGGTWTGTGMTGSTFDPSVGTQTITYTVGIAPCDENLALTITVGAPLDASWTTLTMCQSSAPVDMSGQITGVTGGTWSGTGMTGSVFDPFSGTQSITYSVSGGGCTATSTQDIIVVDPTVTIAGTNISCFGLSDGSAAATVAGGSGNYTYSWDTTPVQTTATATNLADGTYTVTVTDVDGGCSVTQTVTITAPAEIELVMSGLDACAPATGTASVAATGGAGGFTYLWTPTAGTAATVTGLDSAMAYVTVTDINGCTANDSIFVNVSPLPTITISNDTTIFKGDVAYLNATGGGTYLWTPDLDMDCDTCQSPNVAPEETTTYCVTVTNDYGCVDSTCMIVNIEIVCGEVFVPSAFSPNGDGENELECVYSDCMESFTFDIYNRWGEKVFTTSSMNICWDGTWKGKELNSAVFVYILEGYLINGTKVSQKGNISLIR
jgi:gliding motility-associated-like protein